MVQASSVGAHLKKRSAAAGEGNETFVWGKKIDKQLQEGVSVKELTAKLGRDELEQRQVRGSFLAAQQRCMSTHML